LRPDLESASCVDVRDRAAAGADRVQVDHRHEDRIARDERIARRGLRELAVGHDADVGARAADVERDQVVAIGELPDPGAAEHAGREPRHQRVDRQIGDRARRRDAAVRHHDVDFAAEARGLETACEPVDVIAHERTDERVHRGRREALELAELRRDLVRARHEDVGALGLHDGLRAALMLGVDVREQEADRDRLDARLVEFSRGGADLLLVERLLDVTARRGEPLGDDLAVPPPHERLRLPRDPLLQRIVLGPLVPADVDDVAKTARRDHAGRCAAVLQRRVRRDGRAVIDVVECGDFDAGRTADLVDAAHERARGIVRGARDLVRVRDVGLGVREHDVRERPADVDADEPHAPLRPPCRPRPRARGALCPKDELGVNFISIVERRGLQ
jgi:hypothetical protein